MWNLTEKLLGLGMDINQVGDLYDMIDVFDPNLSKEIEGEVSKERGEILWDKIRLAAKVYLQIREERNSGCIAVNE
jgi:hypothetical protein